MKGFTKFSWKRALGISGAKNRMSRAIRVLLTKSGRERKFGKKFVDFVGTLYTYGNQNNTNIKKKKKRENFVL